MQFHDKKFEVYPANVDIKSFVENYFGYGNPNSHYWFIGKEEGGGTTIEENLARIEMWQKMGSTTTVDTYKYHTALGMDDYEFSRIQPTYTRLIQIQLNLEGKPDDKESRRDYQLHHFGRSDSNQALLELMPLASRSVGLWLWQDIVQEQLGYKSRQEYWENVMPRRISKLQELIKQYQPRLVMFYSTQGEYIKAWSQIAGNSNWEWTQISKYMKCGIQKVGNTLFAITTHPTMKGIKGSDFRDVSNLIMQSELIRNSQYYSLD